MSSRRLTAVLSALALAAVAAPASASAATPMKSCKPVTGRPGGTAIWRAHHIRLTQGFSCKKARRNIRTWIGFGGYMDNSRALAPWTCSFDTPIRCRLRTSFGGTKPMRTYRMRFDIKNL